MLYQNDSLHQQVYSRYDKLLQSVYSANGLSTDEEQQSYLQQLRVPARKLHQSYFVKGKPLGKQYVEVDYTDRRVQEAYLLRYFFPHALPVPSILDLLSRRDAYASAPEAIFDRIYNSTSVKDAYDYFFNAIRALFNTELLKASFFGAGPCPEHYGFQRYLARTQSNTQISRALFDIQSWAYQYRPHIPKFTENSRMFTTDLAGPPEFLPIDSNACAWMKNSDW